MSEEKRFVCIDIGYGDDWYIRDNGRRLSEMEIVDLLNEQQAIIHRDEISIKTMMSNMKKLEEENEQLRKYNRQLKERLEKINGGYGHLTHRNGLTANEWLIESQERELKKKNEEISDWIERHSNDIVTIGEQKATISALKKEIKELKEKLDDVLELTEFVGMTSLRKAEIKSIVNR